MGSRGRGGRGQGVDVVGSRRLGCMGSKDGVVGV